MGEVVKQTQIILHPALLSNKDISGQSTKPETSWGSAVHRGGTVLPPALAVPAVLWLVMRLLAAAAQPGVYQEPPLTAEEVGAAGPTRPFVLGAFVPGKGLAVHHPSVEPAAPSRLSAPLSSFPRVPSATVRKSLQLLSPLVFSHQALQSSGPSQEQGPCPQPAGPPCSPQPPASAAGRLLGFGLRGVGFSLHLHSFPAWS